MDIEAIEDSESFSELNYGSSSGGNVFPGINPEPIIVRGCGNIVVFGLHNKYSLDFPQCLLARVAPEEFKETVGRVNEIVKDVTLQLKWLACCCFWPAICLNKKTRLCIKKLLECENIKKYSRVGLKWRLGQMHLDSSAMLEYVLIIEYVPKFQPYNPD